MSDPNVYTVGWICAINTEYVAAQEFLDEQHDPPEFVSPHDNNDYTLGRIGKHNVVIAVLPEGEYGIDSAASVARDMLHTFRNIRIGLMVGIGGGAPNAKNDIRLGDIVVSLPGNGQGGVFQYDFGKTIQEQTFRETRYLNQSPNVVRAAVAGLKAQYERRGHQLEQAVNDRLEDNERLKEKYAHPPPGTDRLYKSEVVHPPDGEAGCVELCGEDPSKLIARKERGKFQLNPAIHFGLIASGNQLMKDAIIRDKLANEKNVLCFEMEAAGLMNHFPCLVIRGICDYSDSHKNKEWQGYAAMVAAAYAKDLLYRIIPNKVEAERKVVDVLASVGELINEALSYSRDTNIAFKIWKRKKDIDDWLLAPDPSSHYNEALGRRHKDSGRWFLLRDDFVKWKTKKNSFFWLHGIPGCGKTVLSSTIIEDLDQGSSTQPLLYFFFDFNDPERQNVDKMIRSLISQLYYKREDTQSFLDSLFSASGEGRQEPAPKALRKTLSDMIQQAGQVWIALDALDECLKHSEREELLSWMIDFVSSEQRNVHLLVTSRLEQPFESELKEWNYDKDIVSIQDSMIAGDIRAYVRTRIREDSNLKKWQGRPDVQLEIETSIMAKSNGMFQWVRCQFDDLKYSSWDIRSLRAALSSLPTSLDGTYDRILKNIPRGYRPNATKILQLLAFSDRPLLLKEVVDAIAVRVDDDTPFDPDDRMPDPLEVPRFCSSLVVLAPGRDTSNGYESRRRRREKKRDTRVVDDVPELELHLAHFSVKEYLTSTRVEATFKTSLNEVLAKASIARICLAYLSQLYLDSEQGTIWKLKTEFPLAQYSAQYWMDHAKPAEKETGIQDVIMKFFLQQRQAYVAWDRLYNADRTSDLDNVATPLYYASLAGLVHTLKSLLRDDTADVNAKGSEYGTALHAACVRGHVEVVQMLLDKGADINAESGDYGNTLYIASLKGHNKVAQLLLGKGANVNAKSGKYGTALQAASFGGYEEMLRFLLDNGADINANGGEHGNALYAASSGGHVKVVDLLLRRGANINAWGGGMGNAFQTAYSEGYEKVIPLLMRDERGRWREDGSEYGNALYAASLEGHEKVVELLLDARADVNERASPYGNALQAASYRGYERIVRLLLDKGADINAKGGKYGSALHAAYVGHNTTVMHLLLDRGADVHEGGNDDGNLIEVASERGDEEIVRLLLSRGAQFDYSRGKYGSALYLASLRGYDNIVQLLLNHGADPNSWGALYQNALQAACSGSYEKVVRLLLDKGADVNERGGLYGTALYAAVEGGNIEISQMLVDKGADVNAKAGRSKRYSRFNDDRVIRVEEDGSVYGAPSCIYGNALQAASAHGYDEIVQLLLDKGADVDIESGQYGTALHAACDKGHEKTVALLLDKGADVNAQDDNNCTALILTSQDGREKIVRLLLDKGADVNKQGGKYGNTLQAASYHGNREIVQLLLERGADVNAQGGKYKCAVRAASARGHEDVVQLLIDNGADYKPEARSRHEKIRHILADEWEKMEEEQHRRRYTVSIGPMF